MRTIGTVIGLAAILACGRDTTAPDVVAQDVVIVDGPLRMTLSEFSVQNQGITLSGPLARGGQGALTVTDLRGGSLCELSVSAHADVAAAEVTLSVTYKSTNAHCPAAAQGVTRFLRSAAVISGLAPGTYRARVFSTSETGYGPVVVLDVPVIVS